MWSTQTDQVLHTPSPVVNDAVYHHPLGFDAIFVVFVFQDGVLGILGPPLLTLSHAVIVLTTWAVIQTGRFIHVRLPLVVPVHHRVKDFQLAGRRGGERQIFFTGDRMPKSSLASHIDCMTLTLCMTDFFAACFVKAHIISTAETASATKKGRLRMIRSLAWTGFTVPKYLAHKNKI